MKAGLYLLVITIFFFISCEPKSPPPEYALTDEQLSNLMLDMQLAEVAMGEVNGLKRDTLKEAIGRRLEEIYKQPITVLEAEIRKVEGDPAKLTLVMDKVQILLDSLR